jgi:Icc-related predicted phosphoesterase
VGGAIGDGTCKENAVDKMTMEARKSEVRLAAIADIHFTRTSQGTLQPLLAQIAPAADILLIAGDLTSYGLPEEAHLLARELTSGAKIPILAVLGNHEYESGKEDEVAAIFTQAGIRLLDGEPCELMGVGFAGVKGFGGGFDRRALEPWGEATMKQFVQDAVHETLKLGSALGRIRAEPRVVLLHYSPIRATVEGEPLEIFPFMGSSRLEEPIDRYHVNAVFHGHAHQGRPEGRTRGGTAVFNVGMSLLQRHYPDRPPFRLFTIPVPGGVPRGPGGMPETRATAPEEPAARFGSPVP